MKNLNDVSDTTPPTLATVVSIEGPGPDHQTVTFRNRYLDQTYQGQK